MSARQGAGVETTGSPIGGRANFLHDRQDLNLQPAVLGTAALPVELLPITPPVTVRPAPSRVRRVSVAGHSRATGARWTLPAYFIRGIRATPGHDPGQSLVTLAAAALRSTAPTRHSSHVSMDKGDYEIVLSAYHETPHSGVLAVVILEAVRDLTSCLAALTPVGIALDLRGHTSTP